MMVMVVTMLMMLMKLKLVTFVVEKQWWQPACEPAS